MSPSIAGATITGHRAFNSIVLNRSSARPSAALARKFAVAGATIIRMGLSRDGEMGHLFVRVKEIRRDPPS